LAHNHNHCPVFRGRRANSWYSAWLSFFYGCPLFVWVPTHNQNHHRYLDGPGDATRTRLLAANDSLLSALSYPTRSALAQAPLIWAYVVAARRRRSAQFQQIVLEMVTVLVGHGALFLFAVQREGMRRGSLLYAFSLGIPAGFAAWSMMLTNYLQHVGTDHASADNHSRNFVSPWLNWLVFQAGLHTVHHEHAGKHWSYYPELHAARESRIEPRLKQRTMLGYCLRKYLWGREAGVAFGSLPLSSSSEARADRTHLASQFAER
jgi:fatty acid desaturase